MVKSFPQVSFPLLLSLMLALGIAAPKSTCQTGIRFIEQPEWESVLELARKEGKVIFFDAATSWCAPCRLMEREVFTRPEEAAFFNENFINVKYDMERGEGKTLRTRFGVKVFPTYLFIDANGKELHRIVGAHVQQGVFLRGARRALTFNGYLAALEVRFQRGERNARFMLEYLDALHMAGELEREATLAQRFLSLMTTDHFFDKDYWDLLAQYLDDPASSLFRALVEKRRQIARQWGQEVVDAKISEVLERSLLRMRQGEKPDTTALGPLLDLLATHADLPRRQELYTRTLCVRYQYQADWVRYAAMVEAMLRFGWLEHHPWPWRELDFHATTLATHCNNRDLLRLALQWSELCCQQETRPEELAQFFHTRANLLALVGLSQLAAQANQESLRLEAEAERLGRKRIPDPLVVKEGQTMRAKY